MPSTRTFNRSFAGGELSPEMFGRIDDVKFQTGAAKMRNFIATPQGPAENRPGTMFVREVKNSNKKTRLISFTYSTTQTMVIEIGEGYFRFHTNGGTVLSGGVPYEVVNPYLEADLFDIHYVQSADVLTLVHPNYPPAELRRLGATNWTYTVISFAPTVATPGGVAVTASPGYKSQISTWDGTTGLIITVNNHTLSEGDGIYISGVSGPTSTPARMKAANLPQAKVDLSEEGYAIAVKDGSLYIFGGRLRGAIYGVYAFLEEDLGCRWYVAARSVTWGAFPKERGDLGEPLLPRDPNKAADIRRSHSAGLPPAAQASRARRSFAAGRRAPRAPGREERLPCRIAPVPLPPRAFRPPWTSTRSDINERSHPEPGGGRWPDASFAGRHHPR